MASASETTESDLAGFVTGVDQIAFADTAVGEDERGAVDAAKFVAHASPLATSAAGTPQFVQRTGPGVLLPDPVGGGGEAAARRAALTGGPALAASNVVTV